MKKTSLAAACVVLCLGSTSHAAPMTVDIGNSQYFPSINKSITIKNVTSTMNHSVGVIFDENDCNSLEGMVYVDKFFKLTHSGFAIGVKQSYMNCSDNPDDYQLKEVSMSAKGKSVIMDNIDGAIIAFPGLREGTTSANPVYAALTGGTYTISNILASLQDSTIYSNINCRRYAYGTKPETTTVKNNTPTWTYTSASGPKNLPLQAMQSGSDASTALTQAGFTIISKSATEITFQGSYRFHTLRMTESAINTTGVAGLGASTWGLRILKEVNYYNAADPYSMWGMDGYGDLDVTVTFSMPLTP